MTSMFWGLRLEPGKRYSTTVDKSFHVSMAALDCASVKSDNEVLSVMIDDGESNVPFIICNLQKSKLMQSPLDLTFMSGDRITLFCKGNGIVHLSGYIVPEEEDDDDDELGKISDEEDDEEGEEADDISDSEVLKSLKGKRKMNGVPGKRKENELANPQTKRKKIEKMDEDTDDSGDEDDDLPSDDLEDESLGLEEDDESDEDDDLEEEESEDEEVDDEDDNDEEEITSKSVQLLKKNKKNKNQAQKQQNTLAKQQNQGKQKTPNGLQSKKDNKKGDKTAAATAKLNDKSPAGKKGTAEVEPSPGKKTLDGGVIIKDIKMGNGPLCKSGKMACVYYTGRFKQNNKVFDSTTEGSGFKFRVGKGEVIKGWDVGVVGMKVGGKRLITCPPAMAYGQKGSPPTIPANSTLVFEVELKSVN
ncbi:hypothetical protein O3M35_008877 [Rhynocoris fuscipes]|uniref:FK506-binding protein n=1 Tax=Rhynocoris fuscipes TaxID=488301 RepID=A0AAW1DAE0_9HEMI